VAEGQGVGSDKDVASVVKVVTIIGESPESFAKAADNAVKKAQQTLRNITGVDIMTMSATVKSGGGGIDMYRTTVNIAFVLE